MKPRFLPTYGGVLALAVILAGWRNAEIMNPDGIAYIRIARYWRAGDFAHAVNGYWGPMLSWLIALFERDIGAPTAPVPLLGARVACVLSAWFFGIAAMRWLVQVLDNNAERVLGGLVVGLLAVVATIETTPDALMCGWMLLAAGIAARPDWTTSPRLQFGLGACLGAAFLAKAVALPIGLLFLGGLFALEAIRMRRLCHADAPPYLRGAAMLAAFALPYVALLSWHYGHLVVTTSGAINHAIVGPGADTSHPFMRLYHSVPPGRVTTWEDPTGDPYVFWSPLASPDNALFQLKLVIRNFQAELANFRAFDGLGLGAIGALLAALLIVAAPRQASRATTASLSLIVATMLPYLPVYAADTRYFLVLSPMLIQLAFTTARTLQARIALAESWPARRAGLLLVALSCLSVTVGPAAQVLVGYDPVQFRQARLLASQLQAMPAGGVVSLGVRNNAVLYTAFLLGMPFNGHSARLPPWPVLRNTGARAVIATAADPADIAVLAAQSIEVGSAAPGLRLFLLSPPD